MNLQDIKEKVSSNFSAGVLAITAVLTSNTTLAFLSTVSSIIIAVMNAYGDYKIKIANARKIEADIRKVDAEANKINSEIEEKEKGV